MNCEKTQSIRNKLKVILKEELRSAAFPKAIYFTEKVKNFKEKI